MQTHRTGTKLRIERASKGKMVTALFLAACFSLPETAIAQSPDVADEWQHIQSLPTHSAVHIKSDSGAMACLLDRVDETGLICSGRDFNRGIARSQVKEIKLSRRGRSAGKDALIGLGVGAGVGAGVFTLVNSNSTGTMLHTSTHKAFGAGAAVGSVGGGLIGALVGCSRGLSAGKVVYRRP